MIKIDPQAGAVGDERRVALVGHVWGNQRLLAYPFTLEVAGQDAVARTGRRMQADMLQHP